MTATEAKLLHSPKGYNKIGFVSIEKTPSDKSHSPSKSDSASLDSPANASQLSLDYKKYHESPKQKPKQMALPKKVVEPPVVQASGNSSGFETQEEVTVSESEEEESKTQVSQAAASKKLSLSKPKQNKMVMAKQPKPAKHNA